MSKRQREEEFYSHHLEIPMKNPHMEIVFGEREPRPVCCPPRAHSTVSLSCSLALEPKTTLSPQ